MNRSKTQVVRSTLIVLATLIALALMVGLTQAQGTGPENEPRSQNEPLSVSGTLDVISIQGRLTDDAGNPINGSRSITFSFYSSYAATTPVCQDNDSVDVDNGLFTAEIDWCTSSDIDGKALYLGIQVEGDAEMVNRTPIHPVPYAFSLRPGARISGTLSSNAILHIENWGATGRGLRAYAMSETGTNYGIVGASRSPAGYGGYFYNNGGGIGLLAKTGTITNFAVVGLQSGYDLADLGSWSHPGGFFGGTIGVIGLSKSGGTGVMGLTDDADGWSAMFTGVGNGVRISTPATKVGLEVIGGSKNAVVGTADGARLLYTEESTEVWFTDYGFGELEDGAVTIPIASVFAQTVNLDEPYHVFVQVYGDAEVYVTGRTATQFEVRLRDGDPNVEFSYRIVGKRLGYEDARLERAPWADDDPNLSP